MTGSRFITVLASVAAVPLAVLTLAACGGSGTSKRPTTKDGQPATLGPANENLGKILVDTQGRTLYLFQRDTWTTSACTGDCAASWPPLRANGTPRVGSGADASLVGTMRRSDGKPQITYNGHPLYRFALDLKPGDTKGEGVSAFGGGWFVVSPAGNSVRISTPKSGYGY